MHPTSRLLRPSLNAVTLVVAATVFAVSPPASAAPVTAAGVVLELPPPPEMCLLDVAHPVDKTLFQRVVVATRGSSEVLAAFAECAELKRLRAGTEDVSHWGQYLRPTPPGAAPRVTASRAVFVRGVADGLTKLTFASSLEKASKQLAEGGVKMGSVPLGLLHSDSDAVFFGLFAYYGDVEVPSTLVTAMTVVKQVPVSINLYAPGASPQSAAQLLTQQKANLQALLRANPD